MSSRPVGAVGVQPQSCEASSQIGVWLSGVCTALGSELGREKRQSRIFALKGRLTELWVCYCQGCCTEAVVGRQAGRQAGPSEGEEGSVSAIRLPRLGFDF